MTLEYNLQPLTGLGNSESQYDVVIIGAGPAGATAALYTARADLQTLVIDKGLSAGALGLTSKIANYPGVPGNVSGADLVKVIRSQAESFGAKFVQDRVQAVDIESDVKTVFANGGSYSARAVIIASGSMGRGQRATGEDRLLGHGVSYCVLLAMCCATTSNKQSLQRPRAQQSE